MRGRVLELTDNQIYLQVGDQLRFRASYICPREIGGLQSGQQVDFEFAPYRGHLCVLVASATPRVNMPHNRTKSATFDR